MTSNQINNLQVGDTVIKILAEDTLQRCRVWYCTILAIEDNHSKFIVRWRPEDGLLSLTPRSIVSRVSFQEKHYKLL